MNDGCSCTVDFQGMFPSLDQLSPTEFETLVKSWFEKVGGTMRFGSRRLRIAASRLVGNSYRVPIGHRAALVAVGISPTPCRLLGVTARQRG
jgi:hypothetical protein